MKKAINTSRATGPGIPPMLAIAGGILAVSTSSIFIRYAQAEAGSLVIAAYRLSIATLVLAPLALSKYGDELKKLSRQAITLGILSGVLLAIHFATWITSLEYTTIASSVVLVSTSPLWVALLSPLVLRESIRREVLGGLVLTLAGSSIVGMSDVCQLAWGGVTCPPLAEFVQGEAFLGDLLALAGALTGAGYLLIGRKLRASMSLIAYIFVVYGFAAVTLIAIMFGSGSAPTGYAPQFYLWVTLLALVPQLLGHSTFNWALGYLPAAFVAITLLGEPVGSTILAYFLLHEEPTLLKLFGAILILIGITITSLNQTRNKT